MPQDDEEEGKEKVENIDNGDEDGVTIRVTRSSNFQVFVVFCSQREQSQVFVLDCYNLQCLFICVTVLVKKSMS